MDILSHALWANLIFKDSPASQRTWVVLFSVWPDFFSFAKIIGKGFLRKTMHYSDPPLKNFPPIVFKLYNFSHSLFVWLGFFLLLKLVGLDWFAFIICGWGLHILLDIFTHTANFFPTPIYWPISKITFSGINWSNKKFMFFNYLVLVFLYIFFYF